MANYSKLKAFSRVILAAGLVFFFSGTISGCKPEIVPSDQDLIKAYLDNHDEYERVAQLILAEPNPSFDVLINKEPVYQGSSNPPVSRPTWSACQQVMRRTFCLAVQRRARTIFFIFHEHNSADYFRRKALIYDEQGFKDPVWTERGGLNSSLRYAEVPLPTSDSSKPNTRWRLEYKYDKH
ncbi:MAG: hypothetical protein KGS72_08260 [Cyanobacteria bacterium REEB67]|nr:hypothetical protein [Cyanobacteria bacterium REEB67]